MTTTTTTTTIESAYEYMESVFLNKVRKNYYVKENPLHILLFTESYEERIVSDIVIVTRTCDYMASKDHAIWG